MTPEVRALQTRRGFLGWLGWVLAGLWAGAGLGSLLPRASGAAEIAPALASFFPDARGARAVGAAYLRAHPEADAASLLRALAPLELARGAPSRAALAARRRRDFDTGRIERVEGWMLARTEVALCALLALGPGAGTDGG